MAIAGGGNLRKGPSRPSPNKQPQAARTGRGTATPARAATPSPFGAGGLGTTPATPVAAPSALPAAPTAAAPITPGGGGAMPTMNRGGKVKKTVKRKGRR